MCIILCLPEKLANVKFLPETSAFLLTLLRLKMPSGACNPKVRSCSLACSDEQPILTSTKTGIAVLGEGWGRRMSEEGKCSSNVDPSFLNGPSQHDWQIHAV